MQEFHWALVFVLEKPQLMERWMGSLGRQRSPIPAWVIKEGSLEEVIP